MLHWPPSRAEQLYQQSDATLRAQLYGRMETTEATVLIFTEQPGRALERLDQALAQDPIVQRRSRKHYWRALALYKLHRSEAAREVLESLLAEHDPPPILMTCCRAHGLAADIALDDQRLDAADYHLGEATRAAHLLQDRYQIARLDRAWARLAAHRGDTVVAQARLESALDIFTRLGMAYDIARVNDDRERLGLDTP
ncbi:MAG: hypothetical protein HGA65_10135 [Oscillochloris sp.]|nr:hypothetical protein [Oscillochloris sp.]